MRVRGWSVRFYDPETNAERFETFGATSYSEAMMFAERSIAGRSGEWIGIPPEHYDDARREGIAFNEADGLPR